MATLTTQMCALLDNDEGQDLIEYALLAGLISLVAITAMATAGEGISTFFTTKVTARLGAAIR